MVWPNALGGDVIDEYKKQNSLPATVFPTSLSSSVPKSNNLSWSLQATMAFATLFWNFVFICHLVCGVSAEDRGHASLTSACPVLGWGWSTTAGLDSTWKRTWQTEKSSVCLSSHSLSCERDGSQRDPSAVCSNVDGPRDYYIKSSEPDRETPRDCHLSVESEKIRIKWASLQNRKTHRHRKQTYGYIKGKGGEG